MQHFIHEAFYIVALMWDYSMTGHGNISIDSLVKFVDVSALLVINLTQFYSTGITVWLGLISNSIVVVKILVT